MAVQTIIKNYIVFQDGEARIIGKTHIKAEYVARMHVNGGAEVDEVMTQYNLTRAEVYACLAYYAENRDVLDAEYDASWENSQGISAEDLRKKIQSRRNQQSE